MPDGNITLPGLAAVVGAASAGERDRGGRIHDLGTRHDGGDEGRSARTTGWANTGGSIGIALPLAVGAAVACPDRRVLCLTADGSGMYTLQALWTMAREGLEVTTVVFANRDYAVLKREFSYLGIGNPGTRALRMFEIGRPDLDWVQLGQGHGSARQPRHFTGRVCEGTAGRV